MVAYSLGKWTAAAPLTLLYPMAVLAFWYQLVEPATSFFDLYIALLMVQFAAEGHGQLISLLANSNMQLAGGVVAMLAVILTGAIPKLSTCAATPLDRAATPLDRTATPLDRTATSVGWVPPGTDGRIHLTDPTALRGRVCGVRRHSLCGELRRRWRRYTWKTLHLGDDVTLEDVTTGDVTSGDVTLEDITLGERYTPRAAGCPTSSSTSASSTSAAGRCNS